MLPGSQTTILLVDNSRFYLTIEGQFLRGTGAHIIEAQTIGAAHEICFRATPDLIYLDAQIEEGRGIDLCRRIKGTLSTGSPPVILLYDQDDPLQQQRCIDAGCDAVLSKPLNRQRFLELGRSLLAGIREIRTPCELMVGYRVKNEIRSGRVLDISSGGAFLLAPDTLAVGAPLKLEIHLGRGEEQGPTIYCDGSVAWENCTDEPTKPDLPQGYGVKFNAIPPQTAAILNGFLKTLKSP